MKREKTIIEMMYDLFKPSYMEFKLDSWEMTENGLYANIDNHCIIIPISFIKEVKFIANRAEELSSAKGEGYSKILFSMTDDEFVAEMYKSESRHYVIKVVERFCRNKGIIGKYDEIV